MIFNYQRGNLSLMVDIDKIDYINCKQVEGKVPIKYYIEIGMSTGRSIDLTVSYSEHYDLMKVLNKFMQQRADFMSAENPFLDKEIDGLVSALAMKACEQLGVRTLGDLVKHNRQEILAIEHIGKKTLTELDELLEEHLLYWGYKVQ